MRTTEKGTTTATAGLPTPMKKSAAASLVGGLRQLAANRRKTGKQLRRAAKLMRAIIFDTPQGFTEEEESARQAFHSFAQGALVKINFAIDVNQYGMAWVESPDEIVDPEPAGAPVPDAKSTTSATIGSTAGPWEGPRPRR